MVKFLTRFIPHLSDKTADLHEVLKKDVVFDFNSHYQKIFDVIKGVLSDHKVLGLYDPTEELLLKVSMSMKRLGACLLQNDKPISNASKSLAHIQPNHIERESI